MKKSQKILIGLIVATIIILAVYVGVAEVLKGRFLFNTTINGVDCSLMTPAEANEIYTERYYNNMHFTVLDNQGNEYSITQDMFDFSDAENTEDIISSVNSYKWIQSLFTDTELTTDDKNVINKLCSNISESWELFNRDTWVKSENAYIDLVNSKYEIVPEVIGTELDTDKLFEALENHIRTGEGKFVITSQNGYKNPPIIAENTDLVKLNSELNEFTDVEITYQIGDNIQVFDVEDMDNYIVINYDNFDYSFDYDNCTMDFMKYMASEYNTLGTNRDFLTTLGDTVTVKGGDWGWWLNQKESAAKLIEYINSGSKTDGEFVWLQKAIDNGDKDYLNYVEIDLTNQHLYMYKDNILIEECDIVSGNPNKGNNTPGGSYSLTYKTKDAVLRGPGYASPVDYWMPFNGGIGMHDATWQSKFGGTRYKTHGSHGCINMPLAAAENVYDNIDDSFAIICYWR